MSDPNLSFRNILLIDDDMDEFPILKEAFEEIDIDFSISFVNGGYKLDLTQPLNADIIFLDINMPGYDGFECLRKIRESEYKDIPVVMYTTSSHVDQIIRAYNMGANVFMIKPNGYTKLVHQLKSLFRHNWRDPNLVNRSYFKDGKFIPV